MTVSIKTNLPDSVHNRLLQIAKTNKEEFQQILIRYGLERLLYRLSVSKDGQKFILKGALLFNIWGPQIHRPTKDLDLLGYGDPSPSRFKMIFQNICKQEVEPDGLIFDETTVVAEPIRLEEEYGGIRILLLAKLGKAKIRIQVDVGFGDAVIPKPEESNYPTLLSFPAPRLRIYKATTVIAEKTHAMVTRGMSNSRMKDYFDIHFLSRQQTFQGEELVQAIAATFKNRGTEIPSDIPIGLTSEFGLDASKKMQWKAFVQKMGGDKNTGELAQTIEDLRRFLLEPIAAAAMKKPFLFLWSPGGPWVVKG